MALGYTLTVREVLAYYGEERSEVAQGIIHVLAQRLRGRLRDMNEDFEYIQQFAVITRVRLFMREDSVPIGVLQRFECGVGCAYDKADRHFVRENFGGQLCHQHAIFQNAHQAVIGHAANDV